MVGVEAEQGTLWVAVLVVHGPGPETALSVAFPVVERGIRLVGIGIADEVERSGRRVEQKEAVSERDDQPARGPQG